MAEIILKTMVSVLWQHLPHMWCRVSFWWNCSNVLCLRDVPVFLTMAILFSNIGRIKFIKCHRGRSQLNCEGNKLYQEMLHNTEFCGIQVVHIFFLWVNPMFMFHEPPPPSTAVCPIYSSAIVTVLAGWFIVCCMSNAYACPSSFVSIRIQGWST